MPDKIIFSDGGANTRQLDAVRNRPCGNQVEVGVVVGYTDGNTLRAYDKSGDVLLIELSLVKVSHGDHAFLENFHRNVVRGPLIEFIFTDNDGTSYTATWMDKKYPLREVGGGYYGGTINLRVEL